MQQPYPISLDLTGRRVLVVGGGRVAARKVRGLLEAGAADLCVVAPEFGPEMPAGVRRVHRPFQEDDLNEVDLCFAATDRADINSGIVESCRKRRIWVNRADREVGAGGDFTVPAVAHVGPITVAVSAGGSPAIAAAVRTEIAGKLDPAWGSFAEVAVAFRERILALPGLDQPARQAILQDLPKPEAMAAFREGQRQGLWAHLRSRHPGLPTHEGADGH